MSTLIAPTVHLNGTSKDSLIEQYANVLEAIDVLQKAMAAATPHMRDYYVAPVGSYERAMDQHRTRWSSLMTIREHYETLATMAFHA